MNPQFSSTYKAPDVDARAEAMKRLAQQGQPQQPMNPYLQKALEYASKAQNVVQYGVNGANNVMRSIKEDPGQYSIGKSLANEFLPQGIREPVGNTIEGMFPIAGILNSSANGDVLGTLGNGASMYGTGSVLPQAVKGLTDMTIVPKGQTAQRARDTIGRYSRAQEEAKKTKMISELRQEFGK